MSGAAFLSLDGVDGTGKSTQCMLLVDWLRTQGHEVVACQDPGGTAFGAELREILLHRQQALDPTCEALLFMASRAQLVAEVIRPALEAGRVVVSDRFTLANIAYQGYAGGLDPWALREVGKFATGGLRPDLTLVLDIPLAVARARRSRPADRMESRPEEYHERVRQGFLAEAARCSWRVKVIDARPGVDEVQAAIRREVAALVQAGRMT